MAAVAFLTFFVPFFLRNGPVSRFLIQQKNFVKTPNYCKKIDFPVMLLLK